MEEECIEVGIWSTWRMVSLGIMPGYRLSLAYKAPNYDHCTWPSTTIVIQG